MPSLIHPGPGPPSLGRFVSPRSTVVVTAPPLTVPGLRLWLAADKIVGLSGGAAVATWADASGRANNATQGTAGAQPSYQTNVINGLPVVRFDGTADWMNLATADLLAATNAVGGITYFAAAKLSLTDAATRDFLSISTGTLANSARLKAGQRFVTTPGLWGMTARRLDADAAASIQDVVDDTNWHILVAVVDYSTGVGNMYVDGQSVSSNYSLTTTGITSATNALAAAVGARADGLGEFWPGDIAELIVYVGATAVSVVDRATITDYLLAKYAISAAPMRTGQVGTALHPGRGPSRFARFWQPLRSTEVTVAPTGTQEVGTAVVALDGQATQAKVAVQSGTAALALAGIGTEVHRSTGHAAASAAVLTGVGGAAKRAPAVGSAPVVLTGTATGRKVAPEVGSGVVVLAGNGVAVKRQAEVGFGVIVLTGVKSSVIVPRAQGGTAVVVLAATATEKKVTPEVGTATLVAVGRGTEVHVAVGRGVAVLVPTGRATEAHRGLLAGSVAAAFVGTGTGAHVAPLGGRATAVLGGVGLALAPSAGTNLRIRVSGREGPAGVAGEEPMPAVAGHEPATVAAGRESAGVAGREPAHVITGREEGTP